MIVVQNYIYFCFYDFGLTLNIKFGFYVLLAHLTNKSCNNELVFTKKIKTVLSNKILKLS